MFTDDTIIYRVVNKASGKPCFLKNLDALTLYVEKLKTNFNAAKCLKISFNNQYTIPQYTLEVEGLQHLTDTGHIGTQPQSNMEFYMRIQKKKD